MEPQIGGAHCDWHFEVLSSMSSGSNLRVSRQLFSSDAANTMATSSQPAKHREKHIYPLRRQRLRVSNACQACRLRKAKCDGRRPGILVLLLQYSHKLIYTLFAECGRCQGRGKSCAYSRDSLAEGQHARRQPLATQISPVRSHVSEPISSPAVRAHLLEAKLELV
jgi:hypothetical protein